MLIARRFPPIPEATYRRSWGASLGPLRGSLVVALTSLLVSVPSVAPAHATGTRHYVAPSGSDSAAGTLASPWRTVGRGLAALYPGDTLIIRGGTYRERIKLTLRSGTSTERVLVKPYPGERPVVQGLLWLKNPSYWTIDGLNVTWDPAILETTTHMVKLTNGVRWQFRNAELWGARAHAALLVAGTVQSRPANWSLTGNCIHDTYRSNDTNQDQNVYVNTGLSAGPGLIERNLLFNATNGMNIKLGGPDPVGGGAANVTVRYNTLYNASQNLLVSWSSKRNKIYRNILGRLSGTNSVYGNIRGYQLTGSDNVASENVGFAANRLLYNDSTRPGVINGGRNVFPLNPQFDSVSSCRGFRPTNAPAKLYGRWAPTVTFSPAVSLLAPAQLGAAVQTRVAWSTSRNGAPIARFDLAVSRDGGAYAALRSPTTTSTIASLAVGHRYRFRVRAVDATGVASAWSYSADLPVQVLQEPSTQIRYVGTWRRTTSSGFSGGAARSAAASGAQAVVTVNGRAFSLVSAMGPTRGRVQVYVGSTYVRTVDLYSASFRFRRVVFALNWTSAGTRLITLRVLGTSGCPRVDLDAVGVIR